MTLGPRRGVLRNATLRARARPAAGVAVGLLLLGGGVVLWAGDMSVARANDPITRFLVAVAAILIVAHACGHLARLAGQPPVLGEIIGGVLLGPSVLGALRPGAMGWLFPGQVMDALDKVGQLGLVVFMFLLGCELRTGTLPNRSAVGAVVIGGTALPMLAGIGLALTFGDRLAPGGAQTGPGVVFFGLALAVTALPVLAHILVGLGADRTPAGVLALSSSAIGDGLAWLVLTAILAGGPHRDGSDPLTTMLLVVVLVAVAVLVVRPLLAALLRRDPSQQLLTVLLIAAAIVFAVVTQSIGLHPLIGAFLLGAILPRGAPVVERISTQLQGFTLLVLLPIFFAGVGLSTSIGLVGSDPLNWLLLAATVVLAVLTKVGGVALGGRATGMAWSESVHVGVLMNCRGVTEIVLATVGLGAGLISELGFTVLVLVAIGTTALTTPLIRRTVRHVPSSPEERNADDEGNPARRRERDQDVPADARDVEAAARRL